MKRQRLGTTQAISATTASAAVSNAFGSETFQVRVATSDDVHIAFGAAPTATTASPLMPAATIDYITVTPGQKMAALAVSTATVTVTEME
jgi:hypothetical protein